MSTQFKLPNDPNSFGLPSIQLPEDRVNGRMLAATDTSITVPAGVNLAVIICENFYWASFSAITLPTGGTQSTTADMYPIPPALEVSAGDTIHILSRSESDYNVAFYTVNYL